MSGSAPNKITGANAGGAGRLQVRTRVAARIAQFWRWAAMVQCVLYNQTIETRIPDWHRSRLV